MRSFESASSNPDSVQTVLDAIDTVLSVNVLPPRPELDDPAHPMFALFGYSSEAAEMIRDLPPHQIEFLLNKPRNIALMPVEDLTNFEICRFGLEERVKYSSLARIIRYRDRDDLSVDASEHEITWINETPEGLTATSKRHVYFDNDPEFVSLDTVMARSKLEDELGQEVLKDEDCRILVRQLGSTAILRL